MLLEDEDVHAVEEDEREVVVGNRVDHLNLQYIVIRKLWRIVDSMYNCTYIHEANDVIIVIAQASALKIKLLEEDNMIV